MRNTIFWKTRELPGIALVNSAISHIVTIIQSKLLKQSFLFISPCMDAPYTWEHKGCFKKSGLASEPVTLDPEHLELNGQVLRIPHIICVNLVYTQPQL